MDRETIIRVEGLGKRYTLGVRTRQGYTALRDVLTDFGRNVLRRRQVEPAVEVGEFWALRDVSFEVKRGEVVGIIGRNGAGKSTLLKILSRITEPTQGSIRLRGRVASLLEVGTGFHPELTGRENIFLNGAILGMHRAEIKAKFDEIVAFAEVERFLDTPVKRYSSGMYVRLAFAVAAHLEPEILIVDEVLAVGDVEFQKKCLGKMHDVSRGGRTVLFVSHNMGAVRSLCGRILTLASGQVIFDGNIDDGVAKYLEVGRAASGRYLRDLSFAKRTIHITVVELCDEQGDRRDTVYNGDPLEVKIYYRASDQANDEIIPSVGVSTANGVRVFQHHSRLEKKQFRAPTTSGIFVFRMEKLPLPASTYYLSVALVCHGSVIDEVEDALKFTVHDGAFYTGGESTPASHGLALVEGNWSISVS